MKKVFLFFFSLIFVLLILVSCSSDNKTNPDVEAPTIEITNPINNAEIIYGTIVNIVAEADDNEEIEKVEFYINDTLVLIDSNYPYEYNWDTNNFASDNVIFCTAYDTSNNQAISDSIFVTIILPNEIIFTDYFNNADNWYLYTSFDPEMGDEAVAEITNGMLNLMASQGGGGATASALFYLPDSLITLMNSHNIEISTNVLLSVFSLSPSCYLRINNNQELNIPWGEDSFNLTIRILFDLQIIKIYKDDILINEITNFYIDSVNSICFYTIACSPDFYAFGHLQLDDFQISIIMR